ncbi:hypothetical protein [Promineifilum sp.]|uniref:hypothetical protein n=1 Tax=Promineifilum sp. TaxID=2664178 RepID=UPI0035B02BF8
MRTERVAKWVVILFLLAVLAPTVVLAQQYDYVQGWHVRLGVKPQSEHAGSTDGSVRTYAWVEHKSPWVLNTANSESLVCKDFQNKPVGTYTIISTVRYVGKVRADAYGVPFVHCPPMVAAGVNSVIKAWPYGAWPGAAGHKFQQVIEYRVSGFPRCSNHETNLGGSEIEHRISYYHREGGTLSVCAGIRSYVHMPAGQGIAVADFFYGGRGGRVVDLKVIRQ